MATDDAHTLNDVVSVRYLTVVPPKDHNLVPPRNQSFGKRLSGDLRSAYYSRVGGRGVDDVGD